MKVLVASLSLSVVLLTACESFAEPPRPAERDDVDAHLPQSGLTLAKVIAVGEDGLTVNIRYVFEHTEYEHQTYTVVVPYQVEETYTVSDGQGGTLERTRTVTKMQPEERMRTVTRRNLHPSPRQRSLPVRDCEITDPMGRSLTLEQIAASFDQPQPAVIVTEDQPLEDFYGRLLSEETLVIVLRGAHQSLHRGMIQICQEQQQPAIDELTAAIEQDASLFEAYDNRGECFRRMGDTGSAIADYSECIRIDPDSPHAYMRRGNAYLEFLDEENCNLAIEDFTDVIQLQPDNPDAYLQRAEAYLAIGRHNRSVVDFTRFIRIQPDEPHGYFRRAECFYASGDLPTAESGFTEAIDRLPNGSRDSALHDRRGQCRRELGDLEGAIEDLSSALRSARENNFDLYVIANLLLQRAQCRREIGELDDAISDLTAAIEQNEWFGEAYRERAICHREAGNVDAAEADERKFNELVPDAPPAP